MLENQLNGGAGETSFSEGDASLRRGIGLLLAVVRYRNGVIIMQLSDLANWFERSQWSARELP